MRQTISSSCGGTRRTSTSSRDELQRAVHKRRPQPGLKAGPTLNNPTSSRNTGGHGPAGDAGEIVTVREGPNHPADLDLQRLWWFECRLLSRAIS
jgi:hypothetical protein